MIWQIFASTISTGNQLLDSAWYVFGAGAFLIGALVFGLLYLRDTVKKREARIEVLENRIDELQDARLQDLRDSKEQQTVPLIELKNFVGALYEQFTNNKSKG